MDKYAEVTTVTSAEFQRNIGLYQDMALKKPVAITKNGRERTVLVSAEEYHRLKRRDRQAFRAEDFPEEWIPLLEKAEAPPEAAAFNDELKDWKP